MRTTAWSLMVLCLIFLGLAAYVALVVPPRAEDTWLAGDIAGYVAVGCGAAATVLLAIGAFLLHRNRRR